MSLYGDEEKKNILLIDESNVSREILVSFLQDKYYIYQASSYKDALQYQKDTIDLILLDVVMPDSNAEQFLQSWQQHNCFLGVPIIVLTMETNNDIKTRFYRYGIIDYIIRPYDMKQVILKIENILNLIEQVQPKQDSQNYDSLTGLAKMNYFYTYVSNILDKAKDIDLSIVYFNIDRFKAFNDEYGFDGGDAFLIALAKIIKEEFQEYIASRFADDHFVVLAKSEKLISRIEHVHALVHGIQRDIPMELKAGIYEIQNNKAVINEARDRAKLACDRAKLACDSIKNNYNEDYKLYNTTIRKQLLKEKYIADNIDNAIEQGHLKVYYQPIIRVLSNKLCGLECLVRWDDPKYGFLGPIEFIETLEKNRLIHKLDQFVIAQACQDLKMLEKKGYQMIPLSINLSRLDFQLCDIYQFINETVDRYDVDRKFIHLEVTESTLSHDAKQLSSTLAKFQSNGFEVWLDDFGSEYSTLNTLQEYSFDVLKIDMKFFSSFNTNSKSKTIITAVVDMAKQLSLRTVAEGIETEEEFAYLYQIGCDKAQGYHFSKPMPLVDLIEQRYLLETADEKRYYDELGKVNVLSSNGSRGNLDGLDFGYPIAIVEQRGDVINYLFGSKEFIKTLKSLSVAGLRESTELINRNSVVLRGNLLELLAKAQKTAKVEVLDFVYNGFQCFLKVDFLTSSTDSAAYLVTLFNLANYETVRKGDELESYLTFLYSIYDRIDLLNIKADMVENIYLNSTIYKFMFENKTINDVVIDFAKDNIHGDDIERFIEFYDPKTIEQRIEKLPKQYISALFRTKKANNIYDWQMYLVIKIKVNNEDKYLSCVCNFDMHQAISAQKKEIS